MTTVTLTNGRTLETGCYIEGHWGQYGPDRLAEIAHDLGAIDAETCEEFGTHRPAAEAYDQCTMGEDHRPCRGCADKSADHWQAFYDMADEILDALNRITPSPFYWEWFDGECFLSNYEEEEESNDTGSATVAMASFVTLLAGLAIVVGHWAPTVSQILGGAMA